MSITVNMELVRSSFIEDAQEHMASFEQALLDLEKNLHDKEAVDAAFRAVHTIKGSSGIFQYAELIRYAHSLENTLEALRSEKILATVELISLLLKGFDHLQALLAFYTIPKGNPPLSKLVAMSHALMLRSNQILSDPENFVGGETAAGEVYRIECHADLFSLGLNLEGAFRYLRKISQIKSIRLLTESIPVLDTFQAEQTYLKFEVQFNTGYPPEKIDGDIKDAFEFLQSALTIERVAAEEPEPEHAALATKATNQLGKSIRVNSDKLDIFVNLVGELVMKNSGLYQLARDRQAHEFMRPVSEMARLVESVRELAMNLRMVPIGTAFHKMERLVRDITVNADKEVALTLTGQDTELDKNLIEKISDPLIHMVRNAIDHGLETPAEREKLGKPRVGKLALKAFHEAGAVVIEISDDGRGLDFEKILTKAREKKLIDATREYSESEIQQFIFLPGFSTAGEVSELSGRGVGMDVVKKNIDSLRGIIRIDSNAGQGMTLSITLPLTMAIIEGFLVRSGTQKFILPLDAVKECIDFKRTAEAQKEHDSCLYNLRGDVLPYLRLNEVFCLGAKTNERESLIVLQQGIHRLGLVIDEPLGEYQTVIKPLTGFLAGIPGIGGATILGVRDIALILDIQGLMGLIKR